MWRSPNEGLFPGVVANQAFGHRTLGGRKRWIEESDAQEKGSQCSDEECCTGQQPFIGQGRWGSLLFLRHKFGLDDWIMIG